MFAGGQEISLGRNAAVLQFEGVIAGRIVLPDHRTIGGIQRANGYAFVRKNACREVGGFVLHQDIGADGPEGDHLPIADDLVGGRSRAIFPNQSAVGGV